MGHGYSALAYKGTALPANAEVVVLFDTTVAINVTDPTAGLVGLAPFLTDTAAKRALARGYALPRNWAAVSGYRRMLLSLTMDAAVTLDFYRSIDRGVTWVSIDQQAVAASPSAPADYDYLIESLADFKLVLTSGGDQTVFLAGISFSGQRAVAA